MTGAAYYMRFDELVGVIGEIAAMKLVAAMGGTRFYVRAEIRENSPIKVSDADLSDGLRAGQMDRFRSGAEA